MYLTYWRMRRDLRTTPGLIRHAFLIQSPLACCTFSIWESETAIMQFSHFVPNHVSAVRSSRRHCRGIWSAYWRLETVSKYASEWAGAEPWPTRAPASSLGLIGQMHRREVVGK